MDGARRPGAPLRRPAVTGTSFAVWAPSARAVRLKGDFNQLGRPRAPDAPARQLGRLGAVRARRRQRHVVQVRDPRRRRRSGARRPTRWPSTPSSRRPPPRSSSSPTYTWGDDAWMAARAGRKPVAEADVGLRDAPRLLASAASRYDRAGRRAGPLPRRPRLHPRRADAGDAAPVRRLVGLPRDVVLRPGLALRRPRRLPAARRPAAPGRDRRDPGLGARPLRHRRVGAGPLRRHPALRGPQPAARLAQGVGLAHLQLRAPRGAQLPLRQRALLARGVPRRRAARRRRRLDALPRLLPRGRASGRRTSTAAARTSRRCSSSRR